MRKFILGLALVAGCGDEKTKTVPVPVFPPPVVQPPTPVPKDCISGFTTGYKQVASIVAANCLSCHSGFNSYDVFKTKATEAIRRINLGTNDPRRMPPPPSNEISPQEKAIFSSWKADGLQEISRCRDDDSAADFTLDDNYIRSNILNDLRRQDANVRLQERFLVMSHSYNEILGSYQESLVSNGLNKAINSVSRSENIRKLAPIDQKSTIYRIDLSAFGLSPTDWTTIVSADKFKIIDESTDGRLIRDLTNSDQPWIHGDNFINTLLSPPVYNRIMRIPLYASALYQRLGVDRDAQHLAKTVRYLGFTGSPISNTNRRLRRYDTTINDDGFLWVSNDTDDNDLPDILASNVFEFPFSAEIGGVAIFEYKAEEWIFQLDNGLIGFALYDFPGQIRQEVAPVTVVKQNGPFDAEISVGRDCFRCHNKILAGTDQVRLAALLGDFNGADIENIKDFYQPADVNRAIFLNDNRSFATSLSSIGIDVDGDDPVNAITDLHRQDFGLAQAAAFFFLTPEEFTARLQTAKDTKRQVPQFLTSGRVTLDQLIIATPDIIREFELFKDDD